MLLICITFPSVIMGFTAGYYARAYREARDKETYTWFKVMKVYDPWSFQVQYLDGGDPWNMRFKHDGSESKLGWDEGMVVKYVTLRKTPGGNTVAFDDLGDEILRDPETANFIDWRTDAAILSHWRTQ